MDAGAVEAGGEIACEHGETHGASPLVRIRRKV
jgi:hypothetical protein